MAGRNRIRVREQPEWAPQGNCWGMDPDLFFPDGPGGDSNAAKAVCATCPVQEVCLEYALTNGERFGIWGGVSERERRRMVRERNGRKASGA